MTPETDKERDEARARVEIITPSKNNPVAEYFSSSNTPETDAAVIASNGQWSFVLKETCQRLERERDEARRGIRLMAQNAELWKERADEAREALKTIASWEGGLGAKWPQEIARDFLEAAK